MDTRYPGTGPEGGARGRGEATKGRWQKQVVRARGSG